MDRLTDQQLTELHEITEGRRYSADPLAIRLAVRELVERRLEEQEWDPLHRRERELEGAR